MSFICYHTNELVSGQKKILVPAVTRKVNYLGINRKFLHLYDDNLMPKSNINIQNESNYNYDSSAVEVIEKPSTGWEIVKEVPVAQDNLPAFLATGFTAQVLSDVKEVRYVF